MYTDVGGFNKIHPQWLEKFSTNKISVVNPEGNGMEFPCAMDVYMKVYT